jgi:cysteinyl-tRNA synthetase
MNIKLHNQLTKTVDEFKPLNPGRVTLYTCGPTVYNYPHIGNWSGYIYWDTLVRTLQANELKVDRVMNITDVGHLTSDADEGEDKLEKGARREGKTAWEVAAFYTQDFMDGIKKLGLVEPTHITKATDFIDEQLALVRKLKEKGFTYRIDDGIYFDTLKFPTYGDFAGLDLDAQKAGARVEYNPEKHHPSDFALWKFSPTDEKRDMEWETPADLLDGKTGVMGFPGWHLECSAMAMTLLGETLDIHTGGIDHIPVHHTNEIAQSEAATGKRFASVWLHNDHLKSNGTKISKSLDNGYTLQDLEKKGFSPLDFRMFILQSHYRSEGNFTFENLEAAKNRLANWKHIAELRHQIHDTIKEDEDKSLSLYAVSQRIIEALNDDLNTPLALTIIDEAFSRIEGTQNIDTINRHSLIELLDTIDEVLGLQLGNTTPDIDDETKQLIIQRERTRDQKDWAGSDTQRDQIQKRGITLRDTAHGTIWARN